MAESILLSGCLGGHGILCSLRFESIAVEIGPNLGVCIAAYVMFGFGSIVDALLLRARTLGGEIGRSLRLAKVSELGGWIYVKFYPLTIVGVTCSSFYPLTIVDVT